MLLEPSYFDTLIAVADDCPVDRSVVPVARGGKKTVAVLQYQLLADKPYTYTQGDVLCRTWLQRQGLPEPSEAELIQLRSAFFSKPQACLRSSPLPKQYGWGLRFDREGRIALCPIESEEYQRLLTDGSVKVLKAFRSKRA